jgi:hypothetical protein
LAGAEGSAKDDEPDGGADGHGDRDHVGQRAGEEA